MRVASVLSNSFWIDLVMKRIFLYFGSLALISLTACRQQEQAPSEIKNVVVIGVDGFSASGLRKAKAPLMDSLRTVGASSVSVRTVLPTVSSPNWASLLMGAGPEQHGITGNDWELENFRIEPVASDANYRFPTIFTIFREQRPNDEAGSIYNWGGFGRLFDSNDVNLSKSYKTQDETVEAFAQYIKEKKPVLSWVHFDGVDHAGHEDGHGSPEYFAAIRKVDSCIRVVFNAIREAGMEKNTLLMIVADHGGIGTSHGGEDIEELTVPMIFYGAGVKKGYKIQQQIYQYDAAATIAFALGLKQPYEWIGRPVKAAFEGFDEPAVNWKGVKRALPPTIYPKTFGLQPPGGLFIDTVAQISIADADENESQHIYYTTDGTDPNSSSTQYTGPFTVDKSCVVKARVIEDGVEGKIASSFIRIIKSGQGNGVKFKLYQGNGWKDVPNFAALKPVKEYNGYEFEVDNSKLTQDQISGKQPFGLQAESLLDIAQDGEYYFYLRSDDGSKLYIDGKLVVDNGGDHSIQERSGKIKLTKGKHLIRIDWFNGSEGYWLDAYYRGPGIAKQVIPADKLFLK